MISEYKTLSEEINNAHNALSSIQASAYLGISEKALLAFSAKGLIGTYTSSNGKHCYLKDELDRFIRWHGSGASKIDIYSQVHRMRMLADCYNKLKPVSSSDPTAPQQRSQFEIQNKKLNLLLDMAKVISSDLETSETLVKLSSLISNLFNVEIAEFYIYDKKTEEIELAAFKYDNTWDDLGKRYKVDDWPYIKACIKERCPKTKYSDDNALPESSSGDLHTWEEHASMAIPLYYKDNLLGVLNIVNAEFGSHFSEDDLQLAEDVSNPISIAVHNIRLFKEIRKQNINQASLLEVAEKIASSIDLKTVLKTLTAILHDVLDIFSVEIYIYDEEKKILQSLAETAETPDTEDWTGIYYVDDVPEYERCILNGEVVVNYIDDPDLHEKSRKDMERWNEKSVLWVPMIYKHKVVGLTCVTETRYLKRFDEEDIRMTNAIVALGATAIENARVYEQEQHEKTKLEKINKRLEALVNVSGRIRGLVEEHKLIMLLGQVMSEAMGFSQWVVYIYDENIQCYIIEASDGSMKAKTLKDDGHTISELTIENIIADSDLISRSYFINHRKHKWTPAEIENLPKDDLPETEEGKWHRDDMLILPMIGEMGQRIGFISVYAPNDEMLPTPEDVKLMELFTSKIASSIELHQAYKKLSDQAITDGLTGLFNHRHMKNRLAEEVTKAERYETPLSIIMVDIDDFKKYNDAYGHPQGDKLLKALSKILLKCTRYNVDVVARYGGEEFMAILPNTPIDEAKFIAERLRASTEREKFESAPQIFDALITLSIGIALFPDHGRTADDLVAACDKSLYYAKRTGKNRVCVFSE